MNLVNKLGFTNLAIIVVSILIGLTLLVIAVLAYELAKQEQLLPWFDPGPGTPSATATSGLVPIATATRIPVSSPAISATATEAPPPTISATAKPESESTPSEVPLDHPPATDTSAPNSQRTPEPLYVHPTYEPTTQPCQNCHSDVHRDGGEPHSTRAP